MLRKLLATGIIFVIGYIVGVIFGFRAAVVDYVENDAESIESVAADLYSEQQTEAESLPDVVSEALEEANERPRRGNSADGGSKGFQ